MKRQKVSSGVIINEFRIERKDIKKKIIYHVSDVHLAESDGFSDEAEIKKANESKAAWEKVRKDFAVLYGESCEDWQFVSAKEHLRNLISVANDGDALVLTGDIIDFVGGANLRAVDNELTRLTKPFISVCGNHDKARLMPDGFLFSETKNQTQLLDLGDVTVLGIDNSERRITKEQNDSLKIAIDTGKPIIIAMHVPIMTDGNREKLDKCGEYFYLNHSDATEETLEFIEIIKTNSSQIVALLAGHLHFGNESEIAPNLVQYVASQGILGNINRYEIGV